jgi:DNA recombination-dependent growth factor C
MLKEIQEAMEDRSVKKMAKKSLLCEETWYKIKNGKPVNKTSLKRAAQYLGLEWQEAHSE